MTAIDLERAATDLQIDIFSESIESLNDVPKLPTKIDSLSWKEPLSYTIFRKVYQSRSLNGLPRPDEDRTYRGLISGRRAQSILERKKPQGKLSNNNAEGIGRTERTRFLVYKKEDGVLKIGGTQNDPSVTPDLEVISVHQESSGNSTLRSFGSEKILPPQSLFFRLRKIPSNNSLNGIVDDDCIRQIESDSGMATNYVDPLFGNCLSFHKGSNSNFLYRYRTEPYDARCDRDRCSYKCYGQNVVDDEVGICPKTNDGDRNKLGGDCLNQIRIGLETNEGTQKTLKGDSNSKAKNAIASIDETRNIFDEYSEKQVRIGCKPNDQISKANKENFDSKVKITCKKNDGKEYLQKDGSESSQIKIGLENKIGTRYSLENDPDVEELAEGMRMLSVSESGSESVRKLKLNLECPRLKERTLEVAQCHVETFPNRPAAHQSKSVGGEDFEHGLRMRRRRSSYSTDSVEGYNNVTSCESLCTEVFKPSKFQSFFKDRYQKTPFRLKENPGTPDSGFASSRVFPRLRNSPWENSERSEFSPEDQFRDAESSSSTSADSITYVFLDRPLSEEYITSFRSPKKSGTSFENAGSTVDMLYFNRQSNSTVTLDSLEVCKDGENSPRAISVDSATEEAYLHMLGKRFIAGRVETVHKSTPTTSTLPLSKIDTSFPIKGTDPSLNQGKFCEVNSLSAGVCSSVQVESSFIRQDDGSLEHSHPERCTTGISASVQTNSSDSSAASSVETSKRVSPEHNSDRALKSDSGEIIRQKPIFESDLVRLMSDVVALLKSLQQKCRVRRERISTDETNVSECRCRRSKTFSSPSLSNEHVSPKPEVIKGILSECRQSESSSSSGLSPVHRGTIRRSLEEELRILRKERNQVIKLLWNRKLQPDSGSKRDHHSKCHRQAVDDILVDSYRSRSEGYGICNGFRSRQVFSTIISPQGSDETFQNYKEKRRKCDCPCKEGHKVDSPMQSRSGAEAQQSTPDKLLFRGFTASTLGIRKTNGELSGRSAPVARWVSTRNPPASSEPPNDQPSNSLKSKTKKTFNGWPINEFMDDFGKPDYYRELPDRFVSQRSLAIPIPLAHD